MLALLAALLWHRRGGAGADPRRLCRLGVPAACRRLVFSIGSSPATRRGSLALACRSRRPRLLMSGSCWAVIGARSPRRSRREPCAGAGRRAPTRRPSLTPLDALPPGLVLAPMNLGPALLLHTHHSIVVAGYHRGTRGVIAAIQGLLRVGGRHAATGREDTASTMSRSARAELAAMPGKADPSRRSWRPAERALARAPGSRRRAAAGLARRSVRTLAPPRG